MKLTLTALLLPCLVFNVCLMLFAVTRPDRKRTSWFTMLCMALAIYTLGYLVEITASTIDGAWSALIVENFAIPVIPWFFLLTSVSLFHQNRTHLWHGAAALIYLMIIYIVVITNPQHMLYYSSIGMTADGFLVLGRGPLYIANQVVTISCMILSYCVMGVRFARGTKKLRRQMTYFIIGSIVAFSSNVLNSINVLRGVDLTPITLTLGMVLFSVSLLRDDLVDVVVQARDLALENMNEGLIVLDRDGDFLYCNRCAVDIFPDLHTYKETEPISALKGWSEELNNLSRMEGSVTFTVAEGDITRCYRATMQKIHSWGSVIGVSVLLSDISEETSLIKKLEELATTDPLTGILNRRHFMEMADRELQIAKRAGESSAVILFDIDHFKSINDVYGHAIGDLVLQKTAETIRVGLRVYDLFCRFGGEEFVIYTKNPGTEGMARFAERLRRALQDSSIEVNGKKVSVTASFGIAEIAPGADLRSALNRADIAMYQAKHNGRNCIVLDGYTESWSDKG